MCARKIGTDKFYDRHQYCCFCGGTVRATTIEHAPPKVLFKDKKRLKGLEFPSCSRCNNGTSQLDQVASLVSMTMGSVFNKSLEGEYWEKLARGVYNNAPEVIEILASGGEEEVWDLGRGSEPLIRTLIDKRLFQNWLNPWAVKLALAVWYQHSGRIFGTEMCARVNWITNERIMSGMSLDPFYDAAPYGNSLNMGKVNSSDQFNYKYNIDFDESIGVVLLCLHEGCIACIFLMSKQDSLTRYRPKQRGHWFATSSLNGIQLWSPYEMGYCNYSSETAAS